MGLGEAKRRGAGGEGGLKVLIWREAEGGRHKVKGGFLGGAMTLQLFYQNYLHIWNFLV